MQTLIKISNEKILNFLLENFPLEEIILQTYKCYKEFGGDDNGFSKEFKKFSKEIIDTAIKYQDKAKIYEELTEETSYNENVINGIEFIRFLLYSNFSLTIEELEYLHKNIDWELAAYNNPGFSESYGDELPTELPKLLKYIRKNELTPNQYFNELISKYETILIQNLDSLTIEYFFNLTKVWFLKRLATKKENYSFEFKIYPKHSKLKEFQNLCSAFGTVHNHYVILPSKESYEMLLEKSKDFKEYE